MTVEAAETVLQAAETVAAALEPPTPVHAALACLRALGEVLLWLVRRGK